MQVIIKIHKSHDSVNYKRNFMKSVIKLSHYIIICICCVIKFTSVIFSFSLEYALGTNLTKKNAFWRHWKLRGKLHCLMINLFMYIVLILECFWKELFFVQVLSLLLTAGSDVNDINKRLLLNKVRKKAWKIYIQFWINSRKRIGIDK